MLEKFKAFHSKIQNLSRWKRILLLFIAIFLPAGILISMILLFYLKGKE